MLVPSPTQAVAVADFVLAALNTDDLGATIAPAPFSEQAVFLGERDHPRASTFARIATVAIVGRGVHRRHVVTDLGEVDQALTEHRGEHREWTTSITIASRLDPQDPQLSDEPGQHAQRLVSQLGSAAALYGLRSVGVALLRVGPVRDIARITGAQQWETRVNLEVTWLCGWAASTPVEWVEQVTGTGQVDDQDPLPFDSDEGAT